MRWPLTQFLEVGSLSAYLYSGREIRMLSNFMVVVHLSIIREMIISIDINIGLVKKFVFFL